MVSCVKMSQHNIAYKGLKSTYAEVKEFIGDRFLNIHDWIDGFQRGLIVVRSPDGSEINEAYSVAGYFINHDGEARNIQFKREPKQWTEKEIREKLRRGGVLDTLVELDENGNVLLKEARYESLMPPTKVDRIPLEQYLLENVGAFPRLNSRHAKAQAQTFELYRQLYGKDL